MYEKDPTNEPKRSKREIQRSVYTSLLFFTLSEILFLPLISRIRLPWSEYASFASRNIDFRFSTVAWLRLTFQFLRGGRHRQSSVHELSITPRHGSAKKEQGKRFDVPILAKPRNIGLDRPFHATVFISFHPCNVLFIPWRGIKALIPLRLGIFRPGWNWSRRAPFLCVFRVIFSNFFHVWGN